MSQFKKDKPIIRKLVGDVGSDYVNFLDKTKDLLPSGLRVKAIAKSRASYKIRVVKPSDPDFVDEKELKGKDVSN